MTRLAVACLLAAAVSVLAVWLPASLSSSGANLRLSIPRVGRAQAERPGGPPGQREDLASGRARPGKARHIPSPYWRLERRYWALSKQLGAANRERRQLRRQATAHKRAMRSLQRAGSVVGGSQIERNFLCIYAGENGGYGWTVNTGNGYYGGLQMDREFQQTYGPEFLRAWGTADHWPVSVQIAVAIRAYLSGRGYYPWPNTARNCGLIN